MKQLKYWILQLGNVTLKTTAVQCVKFYVISLIIGNTSNNWFIFRFALDVVGRVGFGLDVNTLENPNDPFRDMEKLVNNGQIINRIRLVGAFLCPK